MSDVHNIISEEYLLCCILFKNEYLSFNVTYHIKSPLSSIHKYLATLIGSLFYFVLV